MFDSLIHLQDSQTDRVKCDTFNLFDSLIHLQDSQTRCLPCPWFQQFDSLIHLQDSQTPNCKNEVLTELNI